jgi:hypothetical protein
VSYLAWEILHARRGSLSGAYYDYWVKRGVELAAAGLLPGDTVRPALEAAVSIPHAQVKQHTVKLFDLITARYAPDREADVPVLKSAGQLLTAWNDAGLLARVAGQMNDKTRGPAAEYLLMSLPGAGEIPADKRRAELARLARSAAAAGPATRPYTGDGKLVPKPVRITDPGDKQWRKELELGKLTLTSFDLAWVIDSTGSMNEMNQTVAAETAKIMRLISVFCENTRVAAVYFRHETDPKLQVKCCSFIAAPPAYQTKPLPLNPDATALAAQMAAERISKPERGSHNTHPGSAVHGGLSTAIGQLLWNKDATSRRVIVLIGDSPLTEGSEKAAEALGADAAKNGFKVHALTVSPKATESWHPILKASGGTHFYYKHTGRGRDARMEGVETIKEFVDVGKAVLQSSISADYADRIGPLIDALGPYIEQSTQAAK